MTRTSSYVCTVRMVDGKVAPECEALIRRLRTAIKLRNAANGTTKYVKLQGRLGQNNPNAWKYRQVRNGGIYGKAQCIRLADAATADVYVYNR